MSLARIAAIVTCRDLGRTLDEAVHSLQRQTRPASELLIVDDGSTDVYTRQVVARLERDGLRIAHGPGRGASAARNLGAAMTSSEYLVWLDADDTLEPTYFEEAFRILEANDSVTWVSSWLRMFGDEDWEWKPERRDRATLLGEQTVCTPAPVRRAAVVAIGGYDQRMPTE